MRSRAISSKAVAVPRTRTPEPRTKPPSARKVGAKRATAIATAMNKPLYVGFYAPWDESSTYSLQRHIGDLDWLAPVWLTVTGPNHQLNILPDRNGRAVIDTAAHRPLILPVVQNFANGKVDLTASATEL